MAPDFDALEAELARAREEERALQGGAGSWEALSAAFARTLRAERALAAARGEEHAIPCEGFPPWEAAIPAPCVLYGPMGVALVYLHRPTEEQGEDDEPVLQPVVVVHFDGVMRVQAGTPNSEVVHGHRLHGKGLDECGANLVINSTWAEEARRINSVHSMYDATRWQKLNHYFVVIRDDTIECLARGFTVQVERARYDDVVTRVVREVNGLDPV
jgi:hypothetical protein